MVVTINLNPDDLEEAVAYWLKHYHNFEAASVTFGQSIPDRPGEDPQVFADAEGKYSDTIANPGGKPGNPPAWKGL